MNKELISINEASKFLGISIDTLRRWDKSGKLPSLREGVRGYRYYNKKNLELFISDLFNLAKIWALSGIPKEPNHDFYCPDSSIFQVRLARMAEKMISIKNIQALFSLLIAISGEIGNNSFDHNLGNWPDIPGIFFAYDLNKKVIVLADRGQGILTTLKRIRPSLNSHLEAVKIAFTEKISGRAPENRGNGLKFVKNVILENPFNLIFQSGDAKLEIYDPKKELQFSETNENFHGCLALIKF